MQSVWLYLLGVLVLVAGLALSIGLHEIGHLVPAKLFKVKVTQYMIGFGPTIWSRKKGETEYGVKLIPLGGYVSMMGMYPPNPRAKTLVADVNELPSKKSGVPRGFFGAWIEDARAASNAGLAVGEEGRAFYNLPMLKKITVMLGGPLMNLLLGFLFMAIIVSGFGIAKPSTQIAYVSECLVPAGSEIAECTAEMQASPAAASGILPGDTIVSVAGQTVSDWQDVPELISASAAKPLQMVLERDGVAQSVTVTPVANERFVYDELGKQVVDEAGSAVTETVGMIGITPLQVNERQPLSQVPHYVFENVRGVANIILHMPQRLVAVWNAAFGSADRELDSPISVVGVGRIAGEIVSHDEAPIAAKVQSMVGLLTSLNVALFVFNLVPLLPLDGGHIAGALYEGTKRRLFKLLGRPDPGPADTAKMVPVTMLMAGVLIFMTVLLVYADLVKPISLFN